MERLTKRGFLGITYNEHQNIMCSTYCDNCSRGAGDCDAAKAMINKLAEYEDLEEQGLFVRLPVQLGTEVYCVYAGMSGKHPLILKDYFGISMVLLWGISVFSTREEAEKKLEEMNNNG